MTVVGMRLGIKAAIAVWAFVNVASAGWVRQIVRASNCGNYAKNVAFQSGHANNFPSFDAEREYLFE